MMDKLVENKPRFLDQVWDKLKLKHSSYRTEQSYIAWIKRFIFFHNKQHPDTMGKNVNSDNKDITRIIACIFSIIPSQSQSTLHSDSLIRL